ncbi:pyridoxamine 5'-phosphate oxidase family protein [Paracoccus aminovorans]|uniref:pyridoxamine 5'-phosphate oxidase family protein n=1 Tax=Paracoccus aminovorans TaxID=34004 RepID=UPI002B257F47|nr:pyridoxamine 5'-phosphate oxidase family protein [Paracoccus aminovorans]
MTDHEEQAGRFWDRLEKVNSGMLGLVEAPRLVPMSHYVDRDSRTLWFITAKGTDLVQAVAGGGKPALHAVADESGGLFARLDGTLALSDDRAKLDELWNAVASAWFEEGKQDPDLQLMRLDLTGAEIWLTGGSMRFLYEIAKSKVTGAKPDMGEHFALSF